MKDRRISDEEFNVIVNSWWRNMDTKKLQTMQRIQKLYESKNLTISNADLLERVYNLTKQRK